MPSRNDNMLKITWAWIGPCCVLMAAAGCGSDLPEVAPVRGVVEFDGKPLAGFQHGGVIFTPHGGRPGKGVISPEDGTFELTTYSAGDGARIGEHAVAVSATVDDATRTIEGRYSGVRFVIPEKFADRDDSGLTCEVMPKVNQIRIQIRSDGTGTITKD